MLQREPYVALWNVFVVVTIAIIVRGLSSVRLLSARTVAMQCRCSFINVQAVHCVLVEGAWTIGFEECHYIPSHEVDRMLTRLSKGEIPLAPIWAAVENPIQRWASGKNWAASALWANWQLELNMLFITVNLELFQDIKHVRCRASFIWSWESQQIFNGLPSWCC